MKRSLWLGFASIAISFCIPLPVVAISDRPSNLLPSDSGTLVAQDLPDVFEFRGFDYWAEQCRLLHDAESYAEAVVSCETAIELKPRQATVDLWTDRSHSLFQLGQYPEAIASYDQVLNIAPNQSVAIAYQCAALYHLNQFDEAVDRCENALRLDGNWGDRSPAFAWYYRGLALRNLGRLETALTSYERALIVDPDDTQARAELCGLLTEMGQALNSNRNCAAPTNTADGSANPQNLDTPTQACGILSSLPAPDSARPYRCRLEEAIAAFEQTLATNPDNLSGWMQQGLALEQLGRYEQALTSYTRAVELHPENSLALARQCSILNQLENYQAALEACEKALRGDGVWGSLGVYFAWTQRSNALIGLAQYDAALESADRAVAVNPNYPMGWNNRAVSLWRLGRYAEAQVSIDHAIALFNATTGEFGETFARNYPEPEILFHRGYVLALFNQGRILASERHYQQAATVYQAAIDAQNQRQQATDVEILDDRTFANILANQSVAYLYLPDLNRALEVIKNAAKYDPASFSVWYNRGVILLARSEYEEAIKSFNVANQIAPSNIYTLTGRGTALGQLGCQREAIADLDQALNLDPTYTVALQRYRILTESTGGQITPASDDPRRYCTNLLNDLSYAQ
jgi:tetratricopeptide (TPR) repeat protein